MNGISPYSLTHDWSVKWIRIPSNMRIDPRVAINSFAEQKALKAISSIGLISKNQLKRLFRLDDKTIERMVKEHKLVQHELVKNGEEIIVIYTLGVRGALALKLEQYEINYWVEYFPKDILKSLLFFQVYHYFPTLKVLPTPQPFTGAVENQQGDKSNIIYVYVHKGDIEELLRFLKWDKKRDQRLLIVTDTLNALKPLELYLEDIKVRVALEEDLVKAKKVQTDIFYVYKDGRFTR